MEFGSSQVERVLDLMDVNFLRRALKDSEWTSQSRDSSDLEVRLESFDLSQTN